MQSNDGREVVFITDQVALDDACENWFKLPALALDTEFVRTNTFYPKLGLLQLADDSNSISLTRWKFRTGLNS